MNTIERLVHSDIPFLHVDRPRAHFHASSTYFIHLWDAQTYFSTNQNAIWNDAVVRSFERAKCSAAHRHIFARVTLALTNLQNVELTLHNFGEHTTTVVGSSILVRTLRCTAQVLSLWMTIYGHLCTKNAELVQLLLEDSFLYPNLLQSPKAPRCTESSGIGVLLFDYDLWDRHPIYLSLALVLIFATGVFNPLPKSISIILMLLCSEGKRYSFQTHSPSLISRTIHTFPPILVAGLSFSKFYDTMAIVAVGLSLQVTRLVHFKCIKVHQTFRFKAEINTQLLRVIVPIIGRDLFCELICCGLAVSLFTEPSFNSVLGVAAAYFAIKQILLATVDPTGLCRA